MTYQSFQLFPEGTLKVASAGHPCPILIKGNTAEVMEMMGPLPGLVGDMPYDMKSFQLQPGDRVMFMTDGFLETFDQRGRAAQELVKRLQEVPAASAEALKKKNKKE